MRALLHVFEQSALAANRRYERFLLFGVQGTFEGIWVGKTRCFLKVQ